VKNEMTLDTATEQQEMKVTGVTGSQAQKTRMLQMGITPGTCLHIVRRAPMADPVEIKVRGTKMVLRREECQHIQVAGAE
jgi:ferrous iron transport protein A